MTATATPHHIAALRFARSSVRILRNIVRDLEARQPEGVDISLFVKALESAELDEPLVVAFNERSEIELMADGFTRWGLNRPAIDELNGSIGRHSR